MAEARQVGVGAVPLFGDLGFDALGLQVLGHLSTARELLEQLGVTPWRVHTEVGGEGVGVALEPDLVVAAAGRTVHQHVTAVLSHRAQQALDRDGARDAGGVPVPPVVHRLGPHHHEAGVGHLRLEVDDEGLGPRGRHPGADVVDVVFVGLAEIGGEADDVASGFLEPQGNGLGVEPARDADAEFLSVEVRESHDGRSLRRLGA